jgi:hypothetical protein
MKITPEQIEVVKSLGIEVGEDATIESIKELFGKSYVSASIHEQEVSKLKSLAEKLQGEIDTVIGKTKGTVETVIKRALGDDVKDIKDFNELLKATEATIAAKREEIARLKKLAEGKSGDVVKEIEAKYQRELADLKAMNEQAAEMIEAAKAEAEAAKLEAKSAIDKYLLEQSVNQLYASANWVDTANDYVKDGVWAREIAGKFTFKKEGDKVLVYDMEGGIVKDGAVQMTAEKLFADVLKKAGQYKQNGAQPGKGAPPPIDPKNPRAAEIEAHRRKLLEHAARFGK